MRMKNKNQILWIKLELERKILFWRRKNNGG
jgi:hypothetical protein